MPVAIFGTDGNEFFHPLGDGQVAPAGYIDTPYQPGDVMYAFQGDDIFIGAGDGNLYVAYDGYDLLDYSAYAQGIALVDAPPGSEAAILALATGLQIARYWPGVGGSFEEIRGTDFDDSFYVLGDVQVVLANGGDDILIVSANAETLDGGNGTDTVSYSRSTDGVTVDLALTGAQASAGYASGDTLTGIENLTGSAFADTLTGNSDDNLIIGGAGADTLAGGAGSDTASYTGSAAGVYVVIDGAGTGGDAQGDALSGFENLTGSAFADTLVGNGNANILTGGDGDDVLVGGAGADQLIGGLGLDTAQYRDSSAGVIIDLGLGTLSGGDAQGDSLSGIENVTGSDLADGLTGDSDGNRLYGLGGDDAMDGGDGADVLLGGDGTDQITGGIGDDVLKGDAGDDKLTGGDGRDRLEGGSGADTMAGGDGADTYYVDDAGDVVTELAGAGEDRIYASVSYSLEGREVETLILTGSAIQGDGNDFDNVLSGNDTDNILNGGDGADRLKGMGGADFIDGGAGNDYLFGGDGADSFVFSTPETGTDTIGDWQAGIDKIALDAVVFGLAAGPVTVVNGTSAQGLSGDVLFYQTNTGRLYFHDGETDSLTRFASLGSDHPASLASGDFILV